MYRYDEFDTQIVKERVEQFRGQVARRLSGELKEDEFKPLRLQNGVYLQLHAYMLRIAIPYGQLSPRQMRKLAHIARTYDRGYGHFTTRQNIQFNWVALKDIPDVLAELVPMLMLVGISPDGATAAYRVGDGATNIITPLMVYFPLILVFAQRWQKSFGLGSLTAMMIPYSIWMLISGVILMMIWLFLGFDLGPGAPAQIPVPGSAG